MGCRLSIPTKTLHFRLHLSDTVSLDLPSVAGESTPGQTTLPFLVPRWRRLPVQHSGYCAPRWASARASQLDDLPLPTWQTRLTLSLTISHRMLPEPPQFRVSLLPTRRGDYPSGSVALVSCQDVDAVSRWAPMLAVRMRRSSIRCRESRSPVGCCESLLVGRPKLFLSA